jgi:dCTP deaminase
VILSDRSIKEAIESGRIVIEPLGEGCIQPSSVDLHVDRLFRVFRNHTMGHIDVKQDLEELTELVEVGADGVFILHPGEFVLGSTAERVGVPDDLVGRLEGKSSLGDWASSSTAPPASSTPGGTATSRSSCRTWPPCRSRSTRA